MRLISQNPELTTRQVADLVGISNGSAYYVITALIDKGYVKFENFKFSNKKEKYSYFLTPKGLREKSILAHRFIIRKRREFNALRDEIEALEKEVGLIEIDPGASVLKR